MSEEEQFSAEESNASSAGIDENIGSYDNISDTNVERTSEAFEKLIEGKKTVLEKILDEIDYLQSDVEDLQDEITQLKIERDSLKNKIKHAKVIFKSFKINSVARPQVIAGCDISQLNMDHKELLVKLENQLINIRTQVMEEKEINEDIEKDIITVLEQNSELETEVFNLKAKKNNASSAQKLLRSQIDKKKEKIEDMDREVRGIVSQIKMAEKDYSVYAEKITEYQIRRGSPSELQKIIEHYQNEIALAYEKLNEIKNNIYNLDEHRKASKQQAAEAIKRAEDLIGWNEEKNSLLKELNETKSKLNDIKPKNQEASQLVDKLYKRYHRLVPLEQKFRDTDLSKYEQYLDESKTIDQILDEADKIYVPKSPKAGKTPAALAAFRESQQSIWDLESRIEHLESQLYRYMEIFKEKQRLTKNAISFKRDSYFNAELELIDQIKSAELTLVHRKAISSTD